MIKLHVFGPAFGLIDPSPFVVKAHLLLRMAKLPYEAVRADLRKAPKGKFPVIEDGERVVPDSTLIRFHLEQAHAVDFDAGIDAEGAAIGWAFEKLCEDHLYFPMVHERWMVDANFDRGPRHFFNPVPALLRPLIVAMVRRKVKRNLWGQGNGRYRDDERLVIALRALRAIETRLENRDFIGGAQPSGADAGVCAMIGALLTDFFRSDICDAARKMPALEAYHRRVMGLYFPEQAKEQTR